MNIALDSCQHPFRELTTLGHDVYVQTTAGEGIGVHDSDYLHAGAQNSSRCLRGI